VGLYLCIFDEDDEVDGVEVGSYGDYNALRDYIVREMEAGRVGFRFPTFVLHSDCDGQWSVPECEKLFGELTQIIAALKERAKIEFEADWQKAVAKSVGLEPKNAFESFIDVDGEFLLQRIQSLVNTALIRKLPILFQ